MQLHAGESKLYRLADSVEQSHSFEENMPAFYQWFMSRKLKINFEEFENLYFVEQLRTLAVMNVVKQNNSFEYLLLMIVIFFCS